VISSLESRQVSSKETSESGSKTFLTERLHSS